MRRPNVHRRIAPCLALAGLVAGYAMACSPGGRGPCNDCPEVAGAWRLEFEDGVGPSPCPDAGLALPTDPLNLTQVGSALSAEVLGVAVRGTLYDTFDFSVIGSGPPPADGGTGVNLTLSGRYVPPLGALDAGARLDGTFTGTQKGCILSRAFVGTRE